MWRDSSQCRSGPCPAAAPCAAPRQERFRRAARAFSGSARRAGRLPAEVAPARRPGARPSPCPAGSLPTSSSARCACVATSTSSTRTLTTSPAFTTSCGSLTKRSASCRDVHQPVLVHADVDEGAEGRDVGDHALQHHAGLQVLRSSRRPREGRGLELGPRIAAGLLQLGEDVLHGRQAERRRRRSPPASKLLQQRACRRSAATSAPAGRSAIFSHHAGRPPGGRRRRRAVRRRS